MTENKVRAFVKKIGISPELQGYKYIVSAILKMCEYGDPARISYTKLYAQLAEEFETSPSAIERLSRHAIYKVFETKEGLECVRNVLEFPFSDGRVTNSQFLALCSDKLVRAEMEGE